MAMRLCADGIERDLFSTGTRVRHKEHRHLVGRVRNIEFCRPGVPSAIPYCIEWDDYQAAKECLGILGSIYSLHETIEAEQSNPPPGDGGE